MKTKNSSSVIEINGLKKSYPNPKSQSDEDVRKKLKKISDLFGRDGL